MSDLIVGIVAAVGVVLAALIGAPRLIRDPLNPIQKQLDIYKSLPDTSTARAAILRRIEQQIDALDTEDTARRNPGGIALGLILFVLGGLAGWQIVLASGLWWFASPVAILLLMMGVIGFFQGVVSIPRAPNGQSLEYQRKQAAKRAAGAGQ